MDEDAFTRFHGRYYPRLLRYLLVLTRSDLELSRDLLQIVLTRVVRKIRPFDTETALWNWLAAIARNCFIDSLRKSRSTPSIVPLFDNETITEGEVSVALPDHETCLLGALERCLKDLAPDEQALMEAVYFERQTQEAIAEQQSSTRKAVESRLARLRTKLRAALLHRLKNENT